MRNTQIVMAAILLGLLGTAPSARAQEEPRGKELFLEHRCHVCHAVKAADVEARLEDKGPDLSSLAEMAPDAEWARDFVLRTVEKDGEKHGRPYKGSEEELDVIIAWLMSLEPSP